jgi:voltage-gated potassium channel
MIGFFVNLYKLLRAVWHGIKYDQEFRVLLVILLTLLFGATYFYWSVEGWSIIDALYFSVMTMSTIGYGDFTPTTDFSKLFTIIYALLSIGVFVAVVSKIVTIILAEKKASKDRKQQKKAARHKSPGAVQESPQQPASSHADNSKE